MVVLLIVKNADYFIKDKEFVHTLKATYGWADNDEGPFSFVGYLRFILQEDTWIDELFYLYFEHYVASKDNHSACSQHG